MIRSENAKSTITTSKNIITLVSALFQTFYNYIFLQYRIDKSYIHGKGVFANRTFKKGEIIGFFLTPSFGRYS